MPTSDRNRPTAARLLRWAAGGSALLGAAVAAWLIDKAIRYPAARAAQAGAEAPLWIPFLLFVAAGTAVIIALFLKAARRVDAGEDLFDQRHRRRRSEKRDRG